MDSAQEQFIEGVARQFESDGFPRIAGRLYAFVLLQEEPSSLDDFAKHLQVSKTSASTNARLLEQFAMIQRVTLPGDRKDYYEAAPDQTRTLEFRLEGARKLSTLLRRGRETLGPGSRRAMRRLDEMIRENEEALAVLDELLRKWRGAP